MISFIFIYAALVFSSPSQAFIPEFKTILSRTAENHGRGVYVVEQEVSFPIGIVHETWLIRDENSMRVTFEGQGPLKNQISGIVIYENGQKFFLDGGVHQKRLTDDWFEPIFYFRNSKTFRSRLYALRVLPASMMRDRPPLLKGPGFYTPQSGIRLGRVGGVVNYAIGEPTPVGAAPLPGLWIEQDQFLIRKVRFPNQVSVLADQYQRMELNLWLPKLRTVNWNSQLAQIHLINVRSYPKSSPAQLALLNPKSLTERALPLKLPEDNGLREFYSRFR